VAAGFARASASTLMGDHRAVHRNLAAPTGTPLRLALFAGVLDTIANVAMLLAVQSSLLSLAAVLMSLYPSRRWRWRWCAQGAGDPLGRPSASCWRCSPSG